MNKENYINFDHVENMKRSYRVERKFQGERTTVESMVRLVRAHC